MRGSHKQKLDSDDPNVLKAYQAESEGEFMKAIEYYEEALKNNPGLGIVYKHAGNIRYRLGMLNKAVENLEKAVELMPDFPTARYDLGLAYYRQGKLKSRAFRR